ncbi:uncharacterized protein TNCV_4347461 [Trichonephila clavipes]|nr:uncharacterized protein TNCV_4347461 [Trichonephila clavipes]
MYGTPLDNQIAARRPAPTIIGERKNSLVQECSTDALKGEKKSFSSFDTSHPYGHEVAKIQFPRPRHHYKRRSRWVGIKGRTSKGRHDPKCPSAWHLRMVREDTGVPNEGANCAWMVTDEAVDCTGPFHTMWWSSRRLVCRGRCKPGLRVNDISRIHWSQHLLTTQSGLIDELLT